MRLSVLRGMAKYSYRRQMLMVAGSLGISWVGTGGKTGIGNGEYLLIVGFVGVLDNHVVWIKSIHYAWKEVPPYSPIQIHLHKIVTPAAADHSQQVAKCHARP